MPVPAAGMQFFGPKGMAPDTAVKVNAAIAAALKNPEVKELCENFGAVIRRTGLKRD